MMFAEYRQPLWIYPVCLAGSILLNFMAANNFPLFFSTQRSIVLPDMVEIDIELAPAEEEIVLAQTPIQMDKEPAIKIEDIDLSKLLAKKMPKSDEEKEFLISKPRTDLKSKLPGQEESLRKVVDKSGEFRGSEAPLDLSDTIDINTGPGTGDAHFENVYVAVPKQKDVDKLSDGSMPTDVVEDRGDGFEKQAYGTLHADVGNTRADQLIDVAALRAAMEAYQQNAGFSKNAGGKGVTAALVKPVTERKLISSVKPEYPDWAKKRGIEAIVVLRFSVLPDGTVSEKIYPVQTSGFQKLDAVAINAVKQWVFNSIIETGNTIEQWGQVAFHFKL